MLQTEHQESLAQDQQPKQNANVHWKSLVCLSLECCAQKFSSSQKGLEEGDEDDFALCKELE